MHDLPLLGPHLGVDCRAVQPTRGLDVGAIEAIQTLLLEQREKGKAIILISEELEELLALRDRIAVIFHGQIMGTVPCEEASIDEIGLMMTGQKQAADNRKQATGS